MDCSYQTIYESYARMCKRIGTIPPDFDKWMKDRDAVDAAPVNKAAQEAAKLLQAVENRM